MNARRHIKKSLEALDRTMKDPRSTPVDELNACLTFDRFRFFNNTFITAKQPYMNVCVTIV